MKKPMPYDFLLDYLPASVIIKPAIGMFYIYYEGKIMLIFRKVIKNSQHNGIWISIRHQNQASLKAELPAVTNFVFEEGESIDPAWLQLWDGHDDFEETAIRICTAMDFARADGSTFVQLETAVDNYTAQSLYEAIGFIKQKPDDQFFVYRIKI